MQQIVVDECLIQFPYISFCIYIGRYASWTHVKQIPNSNLLVSLHHCWDISANMEIFDIAQNGYVRKIYSFEETSGGLNTRYILSQN